LDASVWKPGDEKKELQLMQYISAIANNGGGSIIIGIKTFRQRAKELDIFPLLQHSSFWLSTLVKTSISPVIEKVEAVPVFIEQERGVMFIYINSTNKPYMANDGKFYSLVSLHPKVLSEPDIRMLYHSQNAPLIEYVGVINTQGVALLENGHPHTINFYPKFIIRNAGYAIEKDYKVELWFPSSLHDTDFSPLQQYFQRLDGIYSVFSIPGKVTLFQQELYTIAEAKLSVTPKNLQDFLTMDFHVHIYFSSGKISHTFLLSETFDFEHKPLSLNHFNPHCNQKVVIS
jgi:hypothetical protein